MGMFDYLTCEYPLPIKGANKYSYQTKDTPAQYLDNYLIDKDGQLWHEDYDIEDRSNHNAKGFKRFIGCMTKVNKRLVKEDFTGEIRFYTISEFGDKKYFWIEFSSYFVNGKLKHLELLINDK